MKLFELVNLKKNKWITLLQQRKDKELQSNLYILIDGAYSKLGGHVRIKNPKSILDPELTYWEALDFDADPDADVVLFGRKTKYGIKISGWGHDGTRESKDKLMDKAVQQLKKKGYWIEVSDRPAQIFIKKNAPIVNDQKTVETLLGKKVNWLKDGWYTRTAGGATVKEIIIGNPKI